MRGLPYLLIVRDTVLWYNPPRCSPFDWRRMDEYTKVVTDVEDIPQFVAERCKLYYMLEDGSTAYDVIESVLGGNARYFYEGCVLKYLIRWERKGGVDDLVKARDYVDRMIRVHENGEKHE